MFESFGSYRHAAGLMDVWIFFFAIAGKLLSYDYNTRGWYQRSYMQDHVENVYCAEEIEIPVTFPYILKLYAKAAIRTQPYDLLRWTSAYFRALANGEVPPVKRRLEYPPFSRPSGITPGYLKILFNQFSHAETVRIENLLARWRGIDLPESTLYQILMIGDFLKRDCLLFEFLAIGCGFLGNNLFETMVYVCELFTEEPEGGSAMISLKRFIDLYSFLASLNCSDSPLPRGQYFNEDGDEGKASSNYGNKYAEPSNVALPGSRRESENLTESSEPDATTASLSPCSSGENVEGTLVIPCGDKSTSRTPLIEEKADIPPSTNTVLNPDGKFAKKSPVPTVTPAVARPSSSSSTAASTGGRVSPTPGSPRKTSATSRPGVTSPSGGTTARSRNNNFGEDADTKFDEDLDQDDVLDQGNVPEVDELSEVFEGYGGEEGEEGLVDMETYEPIGLETLLEGICECLEPAQEKPPESPPPPDPVDEFLARMRTAFPSPCVNLVVPGIGPLVPEEQVTAVCLWLADCARRQTGLVGPRNIRHFLCPKLEVRSRYEDPEETLFKCL